MTAFPSVEVPESAAPAVLYKYLPPERIDILENMGLRFSPPSEFNDTFDTHYLVPRSQGSKGKIARLLLKNRLGILCLTERPDNHLMWVHYARNHTGFVLGFNAHASFFRENDRILRKVSYQKGPKVFSEADASVCFYKSDQWAHEEEWRCVREFQHSEPRVVEIDLGLITHIVFGYRMEAWQIARIMVWMTGLEIPLPQFLLSSPSPSSWTFDNIPKTMSVCGTCGGNGYLTKD
jgi:hypothetical protein